MSDKLKVIPIQEVTPIQIYGRTTKDKQPLNLFWTGSGFEVNVSGSELWVEVESSYHTYEPWISISVNDEVISRQMLPKGKYLIPIFRGMDKSLTKNIKIIKETQAMSDDSEHCLQVYSIHTDGAFGDIQPKDYKIEFIGDSITSGEGAIGAKQEVDWIPMFFSARNTYAVMTALNLNADFRILSQSGWGIVSSWDNNPHHNLPDFYEQICGLVSGDKYKRLGAHDTNDFTSWQPDVVIVNLGTNDDGAFHNPPWRDERTGEVFKEEMLDEHTYEPKCLERLKAATIDFLKKIRCNNKKAHIIWAYGMIRSSLFPFIEQAIESYKYETKDEKVDIIILKEVNEDTIGARWHPGILWHQQAAEKITDYILQNISQSV